MKTLKIAVIKNCEECPHFNFHGFCTKYKNYPYLSKDITEDRFPSWCPLENYSPKQEGCKMTLREAWNEAEDGQFVINDNFYVKKDDYELTIEKFFISIKRAMSKEWYVSSEKPALTSKGAIIIEQEHFCVNEGGDG